MTRRIIVTAAAKADIRKTLNISRADFGPAGHCAYKALIDRAIMDLADDPERTGSRDASEVRPGIRVYHLRFSRSHVSGPRVRRPRHVIVFRVTPDTLVISRLLHERMLLSAHL